MSSSVLCVIKIRANCSTLMPCLTRGVPCPASGKWLGCLGFCSLQGRAGDKWQCPAPAELGAGQVGIWSFEQRALCQRERAKGEWDGLHGKSEKQKPAQVPGELQPLRPGGWTGFIQMDAAPRDRQFWLWCGSRSSLGTAFILLFPVPV